MHHFSNQFAWVCCSLLILFSSCKDDAPEILGTWVCNSGYTEECGEFSDSFDTECDGFEVTFLGDGTYTTKYEFEDVAYEDDGTYVISGDFLILNLESGNEAADRFTLTSSELQIIQEQGEGCQLIWVYDRL
ncbi:MAG: lipocalin family protein [Reichenbachiella sp.]|uniref:lipocalin family protein n=1 Tax=Reichenbachiella sp. TaxID=2184521 RepID=UPI0029664B4A|nr:lipocalin family protein [Reichenbachiella sp.]MDW3211498.1 lipocalin family protein [Reichenbachiella sp.]